MQEEDSTSLLVGPILKPASEIAFPTEEERRFNALIPPLVTEFLNHKFCLLLSTWICHFHAAEPPAVDVANLPRPPPLPGFGTSAATEPNFNDLFKAIQHQIESRRMQRNSQFRCILEKILRIES